MSATKFRVGDIVYPKDIEYFKKFYEENNRWDTLVKRRKKYERILECGARITEINDEIEVERILFDFDHMFYPACCFTKEMCYIEMYRIGDE